MSGGRARTIVFAATFGWDASAPSVIYSAHSWEEALARALDAQKKYGHLIRLEVSP